MGCGAPLAPATARKLKADLKDSKFALEDARGKMLGSAQQAREDERRLAALGQQQLVEELETRWATDRELWARDREALEAGAAEQLGRCEEDCAAAHARAQHAETQLQALRKELQDVASRAQQDAVDAAKALAVRAEELEESNACAAALLSHRDGWRLECEAMAARVETHRAELQPARDQSEAATEALAAARQDLTESLRKHLESEARAEALSQRLKAEVREMERQRDVAQGERAGAVDARDAALNEAGAALRCSRAKSAEVEKSTAAMRAMVENIRGQLSMESFEVRRLQAAMEGMSQAGAQRAASAYFDAFADLRQGGVQRCAVR